jgi:hypothetical protein
MLNDDQFRRPCKESPVYTMKTSSGSGATFPLFFALDGRKWSDLRPGRFTPRRKILLSMGERGLGGIKN